MATDAGLSILDRVPVDRITNEAREIHFGRFLLTVIGGLFFALGWIVAKTFTVLWLAMTWSWTAIKVGWQEGRNSARTPAPPRR